MEAELENEAMIEQLVEINVHLERIEDLLETLNRHTNIQISPS